MRPDMAKVLVERGKIPMRRYATSVARVRRTHAGFENQPANEKMMPRPSYRGRHRQHRRASDDLLGPLQRYLQRQVGRPWRLVYSEICARLRGNSTVQQHILLHLHQFVAVRPLRRGDGKLTNPKRYFPVLRPGNLYVDRCTGLLRRVKPQPETPAGSALPHDTRHLPRREGWRAPARTVNVLAPVI